MQAKHYPFIDLAVHASVRDRFATGDAVAVLSTDLGDVLWANGAAAELLGFETIYDVLDEGLSGQAATRRQIESALSGLNRTGKPQHFMIRATHGFSRSMAPATLEEIVLPDGARALLMVSSQAGQLLAPGARARQIIAGFEGTGTHVAVLDNQGQVLAASSTFDEIGLAASEIARMITDVAGEEDRLVKRMIQAAPGRIPAAIGRLADDPALHLLFAVEPPGSEETAETEESEAAAWPVDGEVQPVSGSEATVVAGAEAGEPEAPTEPRPTWDTSRIRDELNARLANSGMTDTEEDDDVPAPFAEARGLSIEPPADTEGGENDLAAVTPSDEADNSGTAAAEDDDHQPEAAADDVAEQAAAASEQGFRFDPGARPARFVWKINRDGEFSEVSEEFAAAVGPHAADIIGRRFADVARVFNLDPDHVIADLLSRRDTWSGKTVLWPVQGADLVVPVDLAALPTYTRDRQFDGFRGFGIVRIGEAVRDPEALGLALTPGGSPVFTSGETDEAADADAGDDLPVEEAPDTGDETDLEMQDLARDIEDLARMDGAGDDGDAVETGDGDATAFTPADPDDPYRGETPAIQVSDTPMRRESDKIIDLEARRSRSREGLSPNEQAAFREIGARLSDSPVPPSGSDETPLGESAPQEHAPVFGKRQPSDESETRDIEVRFDTEAAPGDGEAPGSGQDAALSEPSEHRAGAVLSQAATPAAQPLPSAFALPPRQVMQTGLDGELIDAIPAALLVHSGDRLIHANAEFFALTGYPSLGELATHGGLDHLLERAESGDGDGGMLVRRADGTSRKVSAQLRSINWQDGQALLLALSPVEAEVAPIAASAASEDEPADARAEALKIETQELRSILETATDGVVILDNEGAIRSMNGSARALFNYDEGDTRGQPFAMLFAHESQRAVMDYVSGLAEHGVSSVLNDGREVIGREASGGFLPLFMTIGRLSGSNGFCAVLRDITQWKRTEEELRTAKRVAETANSHKSDFLARVSHEIRTPLNAIIGFSEMMVQERFGPIGSPRYLEYAHDIGNSGKHVLDIVNDLLDISKIEAGQVQMEFVAVTLNDHLAEAVSLLQPMANGQRVIIRTSLSASVPDVVADQRSIKQIALNILSNAIRFTPSGGQIVVSTSYEPSGNVVIRIRDTGVGMNRKELEQAMKPFGQVGPGPRQRGEGTGLGLPLTKAMVEANRAQFDIVSAPGEGTLVTISFPPQRVLAD